MFGLAPGAEGVLEEKEGSSMTDDTPAPNPDVGPALPNPATGYGGMTLRDWFAGKALAGIAVNPNWDEQNFIWAADAAYAAADAMIAHRNATRER